MEQTTKKHTAGGIISLILGALGIIMILNFYWATFLSTGILPIVLGVLAIILGWYARKKQDSYGSVGLILGIIAFIIGIAQLYKFYYP